MIPKSACLKYIDPPRWQAFVLANEESTPFHHVNWLTLFSKAYGMRVKVAALVDGRDVHAAMPFIETRKPWGKRRLVSLPFTDCVRPLARSADALECFACLLPAFLATEYRSVVLKTDRPIGPTPVVSPIVRHELTLNASFDRLSACFSSSLGRNVRRARKNGLQFDVSTSETGMEDFYRLHLLTRRKLGVPVQPRSFFSNLFEQIIGAGLGEIALVKTADQVLAAAVFLKFNKTVIYKYGASNPDMLGSRPNDLLFYHAIRRAREAGMKCLDFGTSDIEQHGLRRFKSKWGAVESPVFYEHLVGRPGTSYRRNSTARNLARKIIQHSPTAVCRVLGETLYKYSS